MKARVPPGRYFILEHARLYAGDVRKQADDISNPLEIIRETSAEISPPEGFYFLTPGAPVR